MSEGAAPQFPILTISPDRLKASLRLPAGTPPDQAALPCLLLLLEERGVRCSETSRQTLTSMAETFAGDPSTTVESIVAEGTPPVHGRDGRVEFVALAQPEVQDPEGSGEEKAVDHHARTSLRIVKEGDVFGRIFDPTESCDGVDVCGQALVARTARTVRPTIDETVKIDKDGSIVALRAGLVRTGENIVRVADELLIEGYVDFSTGNVDFPGTLTINRGVRDLFSVHAGKALTIHGLIEASTIVCDGDAVLHAGMAARHKGSLRVAGDLNTKYLEGTPATVGRDATILREVTNSTLTVGRKLSAPTCSVLGGSLKVGGAAEVAQLGSEGGVSTEVVLGKNPDCERLAREMLELYPKFLASVQAKEAQLATLKANIRKLTHTQAESLTELEFEIAAAQTKLNQLRASITRVCDRVAQSCAVDLTVNRVIMPGVKLYVGAYLAEFPKQVKGPIRIALNDGGVPVIVGASEVPSPMSSVAKLSPITKYVDFSKLRRLVAAEAGEPAARADGALPLAA